MTPARVEAARHLRAQLHEADPALLAVVLSPVRAPRGACRCGAPIDDPCSDYCGPCGRDRGER